MEYNRPSFRFLNEVIAKVEREKADRATAKKRYVFYKKNRILGAVADISFLEGSLSG